jgi:hypothetical protein
MCRTALLLLAGSLAATALAQAPATRWANGPPNDPAFFPLGVWLQTPDDAARYRDIGVNLYVGLYREPTRQQLERLDSADMRVICAQNETALAYEGPAIVGWMLHDEPDNAQARPGGGYDPPTPPADVVAAYERTFRADPTRPILLNLGQGAAWDDWWGRGVRTKKPDDYPQYLKGCDIASFDIYPVTHEHGDVAGRLEFVGRGVQRLLAWSRGTKPVWACIETARVGNADVRPTPEQIRSEVWIAICSGASGIVYFAHEFAPRFVEAGLLAHEEIAAAVRQLNAEVLAHAPALNTKPVGDVVTANADATRIALRVHRHGGALHVFAASLISEPARVSFRVRGARDGELEAGERRIPIANGVFEAELAGSAFAWYRITE